MDRWDSLDDLRPPCDSALIADALAAMVPVRLPPGMKQWFKQICASLAIGAAELAF